MGYMRWESLDLGAIGGAKASSRKSIPKLCAKEKERDLGGGKGPLPLGWVPLSTPKAGQGGASLQTQALWRAEAGHSEHQVVSPTVGKNNMGKVKRPEVREAPVEGNQM